jgi:hypothetical protein
MLAVDGLSSIVVGSLLLWVFRRLGLGRKQPSAELADAA